MRQKPQKLRLQNQPVWLLMKIRGQKKRKARELAAQARKFKLTEVQESFLSDVEDWLAEQGDEPFEDFGLVPGPDTKPADIPDGGHAAQAESEDV